MVHEIRSVGFMARRVMAKGGAYRVGAVFEKSFYIGSGGDWFCVVREELGHGPLSLTCDAADPADWRAGGLRAGMVCHVSAAMIDPGGKVLFALNGAETWTPPPAAAFTPESVHRGLTRLERLTTGRIPGDGLGCYIVPGNRHDRTAPVAAAAAQYVHGLERWLRASMAAGGGRAAEVPSLAGLIGLGPGLTPSGDDFVGGILIALRSLGFCHPAERLFSVARDNHARALNPISAAHLRAASEGAGSERLHALLGTIAGGGGRMLGRHLDAAVNAGHTSGWDTLAGIATALRAWGATRPWE